MKKFFYGMIALLGVSLFVIGCETEVEVDKWHDALPSDVLHVDETVDTVAELNTALDKEDVFVVEVLKDSGNFDISADVTIPEDKAVVLRSATIFSASATLTVDGALYVDLGSTLTTTNEAEILVGATGTIGVSKGGLSVASLTDVITAESEADPESAFTAGRVTISDASRGVAYTGTVAVAKLGEIIQLFGKGTLVLSTAVTGATPTAIISAFNATSGLKLTATADTDELSTESHGLTVPAGLTLTALLTDTLAKVNALDVYGSFTAAAATGDSDGIAITVGDGGSVEVDDVSKLLGSSVGAGGSLTVGDGSTFDADAAIAVSTGGGTVNGITLPAATNVTAVASGGITIDDLTVTENYANSDGDITVTGTLIVGAGVTASGTGKIITSGDGTITFVTATGYTAPGSGVVLSAINAAAETLVEDAGLLANSSSINLKTTFFVGSGSDIFGIGAITLAADTATEIKAGDDGTTGDEIELASTLVAGDTLTGVVTGTDADAINASSATVKVSLSSGKVAIADDGFAGSDAKVGIATFTGVKLVSSGLTSPALPAFAIGVSTKRA